jgi:hypothetical protein
MGGSGTMMPSARAGEGSRAKMIRQVMESNSIRRFITTSAVNSGETRLVEDYYNEEDDAQEVKVPVV